MKECTGLILQYTGETYMSPKAQVFFGYLHRTTVTMGFGESTCHLSISHVHQTAPSPPGGRPSACCTCEVGQLTGGQRLGIGWIYPSRAPGKWTLMMKMYFLLKNGDIPPIAMLVDPRGYHYIFSREITVFLII